MSEEDWTMVPKPTAVANKWDDEENDDVKENWDDEDEDNSQASSNPDSNAQPEGPKVAAKKKKGKALREKLMEKELAQQKPRTAEELLADKLERQRLQEESDLKLAKDAFGVESADTSVLASIHLSGRADFEAFQKALSSKLTSYSRSPFYVSFLEELFREIATELEADDIKKLDTVLTTIFNEKIKLQKQVKGKKGKKNAVIQMERDDDYSYNQSANYDEFEDFI